MKKRHSTLLKIRFLSLCFLVFVAVTGIVSCGEGDGGTTDNCITMTRLQVKTWLEPGWNTPGDSNFIPYLYFVPGQDSATIKVDGYPVNADTTVEDDKKIPFTIKVMDPPCDFPSGLTLRPQYYDFSQQGFADGSGNLIPFDFIRLIPKPYPGDTSLMCFDVQIVYRSAVTPKGQTDPCPPLCPL